MRLYEIKKYMNQQLKRTKEEIVLCKQKYKNISDNMDLVTEKLNERMKLRDETFEIFLPVSNLKDENMQKQDELENQLKNCQKQKNELGIKIDELEKEESHLFSMLLENKEVDYSGKSSLSNSSLSGIVVLEDQETERQRIARDLHDLTVQNLTALIHKIDFCAQILEIDPIRAKIELAIINKTIRESIDGIREIIFNLRPMTFDDIGFTDTLKRTIDKMQRGMDTSLYLKIEGDINNIKPIIQLTVLRLVQEAINNCRKHANANICNILLRHFNFNLYITIEDDGMGFTNLKDCDEINKIHSGFGLSIMKERVRLLDGEILFFSEGSDGGVRIEIKIPTAL